MCKSIEVMLAEVKERTELENIINVMEGLEYSAQQAMELLKIPVADQEKYLSKI